MVKNLIADYRKQKSVGKKIFNYGIRSTKLEY